MRLYFLSGRFLRVVPSASCFPHPAASSSHPLRQQHSVLRFRHRSSHFLSSRPRQPRKIMFIVCCEKGVAVPLRVFLRRFYLATVGRHPQVEDVLSVFVVYLRTPPGVLVLEVALVAVQHHPVATAIHTYSAQTQGHCAHRHMSFSWTPLLRQQCSQSQFARRNSRPCCRSLPRIRHCSWA